MPELHHLHHVALTVRNRDASADWYRSVLGLVEHLLGPRDRFDPRRTGLDHVAFPAGSRAELVEWASRLDAHGVAHSGVIDVPGRGILNAQDPDGIAVSFFWDARS